MVVCRPLTLRMRWSFYALWGALRSGPILRYPQAALSYPLSATLVTTLPVLDLQGLFALSSNCTKPHGAASPLASRAPSLSISISLS